MLSNILKRFSSTVCYYRFASTSSCYTTKFSYRQYLVSDLSNANLIDTSVSVYGWLQHRRKKLFGVLRDHSGLIQFILPISMKEQREILEKTPFESCIHVKGILKKRPERDINTDMTLGHLEIHVTDYKVINVCLPELPVNITKYHESHEITRLKYRYLDFRRDVMQERIRFRSSFIAKVREFLLKNSFVDIETPSLFRRTPGGAREFIVPTHLNEGGLFYALTQSPQQFKQLLMVGGFDRYFQIAKCFRDETGRPDRQPEFTQIDLELSFVSRENIFSLVEQLIVACWPEKLEKVSFPRLTFAEAMSRYGTDKPDTRFGLEIEHSSEQLSIASPIPINNINDLIDGDNDIKYDANNRKFLLNKTNNEQECLIKMGKLRLNLADVLEKQYGIELRKRRQWNFLWIIDFPLFTPMEDDRTKFESTHHPFTAPINEHLSLLSSKKDWPHITGQHYDLVLNGFEVAGGSIRIYDSSIQRFVLNDVLQLPIEHLEHLLKALEYGAPPHGGIALGLDRLLALVLETEHIRDVIAFPKTSNGKDLMAQAPSLVEQSELDYYFLQINRKHS
ncbi:unnamed protein product [Rotaria magnacalcarata]|uniref:Aminoacyl-transfer RNA synthetases class-II family profile domain-containing protein n=1 Tax=Rotaria magnacalcarata TaxID=392030 RepID=A0A814HRB1_9BILA|nr:unnamed protein product [Rotaria magnacalcarata]CAF1673665.1 unnamed protein product [Rotaria magnacalcarata]CAF1931829.1 unnamed protein product [Rotaria magnacalcarata]CAF3818629.1 unnamed protein product [Rotaria magnacalcarata]CAF3859105.1 unnamed protein product [Rotaria magnacalcarata]